ncbi:prolipoprotein diacylglyceryl transferase [Histidinibacterium aquaticum]|uniref:Phosphatidylglycerol--prolipoprotein diacylglyceryl transferase n=1 Tax=Histidinibacterium aquaticum TaxID=2613962 RepID=A0A5J5GKY2_9RHOB|nr:prolipoprotein diacylglyceryl transferase [Histidinibacterium aquaticum]KAA9008204.1 prolipoprotein diacylglyceryl transferase [Histidinibacterium aquaticum]
MSTGILFPEWLSPEIVTIPVGGIEFALRWYAMAYIVGILIGWRLIVAAVSRPGLWTGGAAPMTREQVEDMVTWLIVGIIVGGRLGFVFFYQPAYYLQNPLQIPAIWQGGMSFHGGFLGVVLAVILCARKYGSPLGSVADLLALATPPALFLGRLANFVNAELWGRPTEMPWGVVFPGELAQACPGVEGLCARHPSQIYEALLEGVLLGTILLVGAFRAGWLKRPWLTTGVFLLGYGLSRFVVEFYRQADAQFVTPENPWGHVLSLGDWGITMGQLLSLPMVAAGLLALALSARGRRARGAA